MTKTATPETKAPAGRRRARLCLGLAVNLGGLLSLLSFALPHLPA